MVQELSYKTYTWLELKGYHRLLYKHSFVYVESTACKEMHAEIAYTNYRTMDEWMHNYLDLQLHLFL